MIVPLLARPNPNGAGYELISGHRRKAACAWAGITDVPVVVRDLDDNQAVIAMVNSNLQREHLNACYNTISIILQSISKLLEKST